MNACRVIKNRVGLHTLVARGGRGGAHTSDFLLLSAQHLPELDVVFLKDQRLLVLVIFFVGLIVSPSLVVLPGVFVILLFVFPVFVGRAVVFSSLHLLALLLLKLLMLLINNIHFVG